MLVEFRRLGGQSGAVGVRAQDVVLVEPVHHKVSEDGSFKHKLVGSQITLASGEVVVVDSGPGRVVSEVNMTLKERRPL